MGLFQHGRTTRQPCLVNVTVHGLWREQAGGRLIGELSLEGSVEEGEEVAMLFAARRARRPHALVVTSVPCTARALSKATIDHAVAEGLFPGIIRRFAPVSEHEPQVILRQVVWGWGRGSLGRVGNDGEPGRKRLGFLCHRRLPHQLQKTVAMRAHRARKALGGHRVAAMPGRKQPPRSLQQLLSPRLRLWVWVGLQEPDGADQGCPAILGLDPKVPRKRAGSRAISAVHITDEFVAAQLFQHVS